MEALLQQECLTERQLDTYKSQLGLVEGQLEAGASETDTTDLQQLRDNLSQLITLTEDSLLDVKKQRLLLSLQSVTEESSSLTAEQGSRGGGEEGEGEEGGREEIEREEGEREGSDDSDDLQGIKCRAPVKESWGPLNYHNAVILCREDGGDSGKEEEGGTDGVKVRVLFTHPTYKAMKPCPFYLDGKCKFESDMCKFSHGHAVAFSQLLTYQEPDYSFACVGGKCIAKYSDNLWYPAVISSFEDEFTVHFPSLNKTIQTPIENVFPLEGSESSDSCDSGEDVEGEEGEEEVVVEWTPSGAQRMLGEWEKHTTGIGSKLLAKMGYVVGKGLGKSGEGRVEPVEIKILPAGKSLDVCAEMRERGKVRRAPGEEGAGKGRRRRRKRKLAEVAGVYEAEKVNVFDFLNAKLRKSNSVDENRSMLGPKSGNLNVQLFTVQEEIKSVLKRRHSLKTQLARHKGRDKTMETHVSEKLFANDREMERLQTEERRIEKSLEQKSERKKLRIF